jgi:hypothetical protein
VHLATGFSYLCWKTISDRASYNVVAFTDGKDQSGNYALPALHNTLRAAEKLHTGIGQTELHVLRMHLRSLVNNDEAVFPV